MSKRLTTNEFIEKSLSKHGEKYDYSLVDYKGSLKKVVLKCSLHGTFEQTPGNHLSGKGCVKCGNIKYDISTFISKVSKIHKKLDFIKFEYIGCSVKSIVICKEHGEYMSTPNNLLNGCGCRSCYNETLRSNTEKFIKKSRIVHLDKYNYKTVKYIDSKTSIEIICNIHGIFRQTPSVHLSGSGCKECMKDKFRKDIHVFLNEAYNLFNSKYLYNIDTYINSKTNIEVKCDKHGYFYLSPDAHINNIRGCPKCGRQTSKKEVKWLELYNNKIDKNIILNINGKIYKPDGYDQTTNTIYEFYGDYWHGNPNIYNSEDLNKSCKKKFGELYRKTIEREDELKLLGYNIVSIWESDFKKELIE